MAAKHGVLRLLARISRVFTVVVKHVVMFFRRLSVTVAGILMVMEKGVGYHTVYIMHP
jgi:hypothetical protein